ncbi:hypothetical protein BX600DRAFT_536353 [Xylariales sp. PMI_506]|nr:hypothetical protein BX600DRAFT_536353 [Xylariales sp. PMI_506]
MPSQYPRRGQFLFQPNYFTCTFCWHLSRGPPHVLGRSARLSCEACFNAIIDLAICWVCGELVYRGSECVSLGWCFWHRFCYGCLFCGSRIIARGISVAELFARDDEEDHNEKRTGYRGDEAEGWGRGKEVLEIPLCANCLVNNEVDGRMPGQPVLTQRALRRIGRADGGLSRARWERKEGMVSRSTHGRIQRVPRMSEDSNIGGNRPPTSLPTSDGATEDRGDSGKDILGGCVTPVDPAIYFSIHDPLGLPAFKPSPTKPLPRWMQTLPNQHLPQRDVRPRPRSVLDDHFQRPPPPTRKSPVVSSKICPTVSSATSARSITPSRCSTEDQKQDNTTSAENGADTFICDTTFAMPRSHNVSFVTSEPLKRPSSRLLNQQQRYMDKIPQYAAYDDPRFITKTHYSGVGISTPISESSSKKSDSQGSLSRVHRASSPLTAAAESVVAHLKNMVRRMPPPKSKEYLDLYKPVTHASSTNTEGKRITTASASIAVAGRKKSRRLGYWRREEPAPEIGTSSARDSTSDTFANIGNAVNKVTILPAGPMGMEWETSGRRPGKEK